jgi:hypothetical protein
MQGDSANKGFTLIVLIVTVSIVSLLGVVTVPSFTQFIDESRDRAVVHKLIKSLVAARSEAVVRAGPVSLSAIDDNWANSWLSWVGLIPMVMAVTAMANHFGAIVPKVEFTDPNGKAIIIMLAIASRYALYTRIIARCWRKSCAKNILCPDVS